MQFDESMSFWGVTYRGMGEGLLKGTWVIPAAALPKKKHYPSMGNYSKNLHHQSALDNLHIFIPWKNCLFPTNSLLSI